ncbi:protein of unknown function (plasmid) [Caballeronia sp. S22]
MQIAGMALEVWEQHWAIAARISKSCRPESMPSAFDPREAEGRFRSKNVRIPPSAASTTSLKSL